MEGVYKNGIPLLLYLDIFKNFFANTQEKKFYMLKGAGEVTLNFQDTYQSSHDGDYTIGKNQESVQITKTTKIKTNLTNIDYQRFWDSIKVTILETSILLHEYPTGGAFLFLIEPTKHPTSSHFHC